MKKKKSEVKKLALEHYDRMIKFAEWLIASGYGRKSYHDNAILYFLGEGVDSEDCAYCKFYDYCEECPLSVYPRLPSAPNNCCNSLWHKMKESKTWISFLTNVKKVREYIKEKG